MHGKFNILGQSSLGICYSAEKFIISDYKLYKTNLGRETIFGHILTQELCTFLKSVQITLLLIPFADILKHFFSFNYSAAGNMWADPIGIHKSLTDT
jgi:hypothetical protein